MSRQLEAKKSTLIAYPVKCRAGVEFFLDICAVSENEFKYSENISAEEYLYGGSNSIDILKSQISLKDGVIDVLQKRVEKLSALNKTADDRIRVLELLLEEKNGTGRPVDR